MLMLVLSFGAALLPPWAPLAARTSDPRAMAAWVGETSAEITIRASQEAVCAAYGDIERMPEWSPMLERVVVVDRQARRSEWKLRVPRALGFIVRAAGMENAVQWEATHEVQPPRALRWRSLSGVENAGEALFTPAPEGEGWTVLRLSMSYTLPEVVRPLVQAPPVQAFVRSTMLSTMRTFKEALEAEVSQEEPGPSAREAAVR